MLTFRESYEFKEWEKIILHGRRILHWGKEDWKTSNYLNLKLQGNVNPYHKNYSDVYMKGQINPQFSGNKDKVSYFTEVQVWTEYQSDTTYYISDYEPFHGNPYNLYGRVKYSSIRSSDIFRGGIVYKGKSLDMETAVDYLRQGPAFFFPLTLSGETSPLTYFKARLDLSKIRYIHSFGQLRMQKNKPKYFYSHRLDFSLFKNLVLFGINEVLINGSTAEKTQTDSLKPAYYNVERTWEWVYLIPFVPFQFAQHYTGDRDNGTLSFDVDVFAPRKLRWYLEFFLDDIDSPFTIFSDDYGNKWAATLGAQYFDVVFKKDIFVTLEYSRVEPWVYTHFYGGSHNYTHFGESLGSPIGPNSAALKLQMEYSLGMRHVIGLALKNIRTNNSTRGGSITDVFQDPSKPNGDSTKKKFLGHGTKSIIETSLLWAFNPLGVFTVTTEVLFDSEKKVGLDVWGGFYF
jgi:hypothetical protein